MFLGQKQWPEMSNYSYRFWQKIFLSFFFVAMPKGLFFDEACAAVKKFKAASVKLNVKPNKVNECVSALSEHPNLLSLQGSRRLISNFLSKLTSCTIQELGQLPSPADLLIAFDRLLSRNSDILKEHLCFVSFITVLSVLFRSTH